MKYLRESLNRVRLSIINVFISIHSSNYND
jgi:hypothetical protein